MENGQTAVEWFAVNAMGLLISLRLKRVSLSEFESKYNDYLEKARQMEEKEHEKIANKSREEGWKEGKYGSSRW